MAVSANDSVRITEKCWQHCIEGRLDLASQLMRADFVHDDRRRGLSNTLFNRDDTLANNAVVAELGFVPQPFETIATHGDSLALCRVSFRDSTGNELAATQVLGTDDAGLRAFCISFDDGAIEPATEEFDRLRAAADDPTPVPHVASIYIAAGSRLPMKPVDEVTFTAGKGIPGDRYENSRHRHVTIQSQADLDEASAALGTPIDPSATRRNITISHGSVPAAPGERMCIGTVEFEVVRIAAPCKLLDDTIGDGARTALRRRAGSVFRVLSGGTIRLQDPVDLGTVS